eukprot:5381853-Prymnesium_polylepis.1
MASSWSEHREARTWRARAGERGSSTLAIGQLSAAQAGAVCCTICSSCTRLGDVRPRRYSPTGLQQPRARTALRKRAS